MKVRYLTATLFGTAAVASILAVPAAQSSAWHHHEDHVLGTSFDMTTVAKDQMSAARAFIAAKVEIARLDKILSAWRSDSELQTLNSASTLKVSPDLYDVIVACEDWRIKTEGAYSARLGRLFGKPADSEHAAIIATADVGLDGETQTVTRPISVTFAVDGLAKGYIVDRALEAARRAAPDAEGLMINIGGDIRCWGRAPAEGGWAIGVVDHHNSTDNATPASVLRLQHKAVATSGKGDRAPSLMSPQSGELVHHVVLATVIADKAADADALATAFAVAAPEKSIALADRLGVATRVVTADGKHHVSAHWDAFQDVAWKPVHATPVVAKKPALAAGDSPMWPKDFVLNVQYSSPESGDEHHDGPYIVMWITDEKGELVRTLTYYGQNPKYFDENYVFWNHYGEANRDVVLAVTRPTRGSGLYDLNWDGLDDWGNPVPQGKYTLSIESSHEYDGHGITHIDFVVSNDEFAFSEPSQGRIGDVWVSFGKAL